MRSGASAVCQNLLLLMNSSNKTEAVVFSCRLCFMGAFPFISLIKLRCQRNFNNKHFSVGPSTKHLFYMKIYLT